MDFQLSPRAQELSENMWDFLNTRVLPSEKEYDRYRTAVGPNDSTLPPIVEELKVEARARGLWNLFLPAESGLTNTEYASLAEISGWSMDILPEAINCQAPDTGNMETLHLFGTPEQKATWLAPLLDGTMRSAFVMTEPAVASSDATNITCSIERDGDEWVINGLKWWASGAMDPRCEIFIVMGKTDPDGPAHRRQSMVLVPRNTPGVTIERSLPVLGH
jgi:acyl-CoA dehydrogenase